MRPFPVFFCCLLCFYIAGAQQDNLYQTLIARASLMHLQENYKNAIEFYEQAFKIQKPDALTSYKAAAVYSLDKNANKAFHYLQTALDSGWTEADWLSFDPYFDFLRHTHPDEWKATERNAKIKEQQYGKTLVLPGLRKEINLMTLKDQQLRYRRVQSSNDSVLALIGQQISQSDLNNLNRAKEIIAQYGWLKKSQIGKDGQNNLWLIVQHADHDVKFQQTVLHAMEKLKGTVELTIENYAFLYDRVKCNLNYKQLYGTQVVWTGNGKASGFRPIAEENMVDSRRKVIGMQPMSTYALTYGFKYRKPTTGQSRKNEAAEHENVHQLIDSAKYFYSTRQFQKTYDYYNAASTFSGGMDKADNLEAAILFSKIGVLNKDEKYKSIALDFLYLLYLRGDVSKLELHGQPAFKILHQEQRWQDMIRHLDK